ncbi:MAG: hypothetical protein K2W95_30910 [Candidatus Obscuribacterales bacterium]|nr:hypothetical protein [Candidatus Obscuribacterales bacterium]
MTDFEELDVDRADEQDEHEYDHSAMSQWICEAVSMPGSAVNANGEVSKVGGALNALGRAASEKPTIHCSRMAPLPLRPMDSQECHRAMPHDHEVLIIEVSNRIGILMSQIA